MQNYTTKQQFTAEKSIDEAISCISISQPSMSSVTKKNRRGGRGLRRNRTIHHGQSSFTDRFSFKTRANQVLLRNDQMIADNQTRPSWGSLFTTSQNMSNAEKESAERIGLNDNFIMSPISGCFLKWFAGDDLTIDRQAISIVNKVYIQEGVSVSVETMKELEGKANVEIVDFRNISFMQLLNETRDKNCVLSILPISNTTNMETVMFLISEFKFKM
ncbi:predicted protein [Naegleria gruberi]|uniref:Predicted protein n=1 Tax=Naegleria gruberi TaxID=5762 RepID=D2VDH1_NAEGR|nr:uncharacterized protein NAEGRDRAFT_66841 [Naegleria gruberi]EFC45141.1 predicted protein [Naegleria gruberi]|eukprot:XP_002677885.1 predicted protein [Naegleria gruberi strain NEG-M]